MPATARALRSSVTCLDRTAGFSSATAALPAGACIGSSAESDIGRDTGGVTTTSGMETPARLSCSRRWAACSIRLVIGSTLSGSENRHADQYHGEGADQGAGRQREPDQIDL